MNEYPEGVIVADVLDGCGDNLQVTYSDNWKRIINGDLAAEENGSCCHFSLPCGCSFKSDRYVCKRI